MRLFVGIVPSPEAISHAAGAVDRIASTTPDMRWVPSERWHVTLAFLGEVDPDRVPELTSRLDHVAVAHEPIEGLCLDGSGSFPGVLWLGVGNAAEQTAGNPRFSAVTRLGGLADAIQREMPKAGVHLESRPWQPHLTVGRWRPSPRREGAARDAARSLADYAGPGFSIDEVRLVESMTDPEPEYRDVHVVRLGARGD
ncbi:MAG: RNA 2',3'-cyclic phosphodiesterase [Candidatus Nanopelagicales bacterium]